MKKLSLKNNINLVAKRNLKDHNKLDYYLKIGGKKYYAFSRRFSITCYRIYKSGVPINTALHARDVNTAHMNLVKYLNFVMPYLIELFGLNDYAKKVSNRSKQSFEIA